MTWWGSVPQCGLYDEELLAPGFTCPEAKD